MRKKTNIEFISHAKLVHGQFNQMPNAHLSGQGCPGCNLSKGEYRVEKYLQSNSIEYIRQYKFDECKNKKSYHLISIYQI